MNRLTITQEQVLEKVHKEVLGYIISGNKATIDDTYIYVPYFKWKEGISYRLRGFRIQEMRLVVFLWQRSDIDLIWKNDIEGIDKRCLKISMSEDIRQWIEKIHGKA